MPQGVELIDAGREMLEKARTALDAAAAEAFAERHRLLDNEIHLALSELLQRQVAAGELDVAIVFEPSRRSGLHYELLREEEVFAWTHPERSR